MNPDSRQLADSLRAVRVRWHLVLLVVALSTGVAILVAVSAEKQYDATAQLLLRGEEPINALLDPASAAPSTDPERDLNTEVALIKVGPTAIAVKRTLGLRRSADALLREVQTESSASSDIVRLRVRDPDPVLAARIANAFADAYVQFRVNSARKRYRQAAELAQRQLLALSPLDRRSVQGRDLQSRQRELEIASALQTGGAEVVRKASVPTGASRPRPKLSGALGLILGLILGVGSALLLNLVDRRFKDEREVEDFFGLPVLAAIPRPARRGADLHDPAQREAFGLLASNVRLSTTAPGSSVVMITSPAPGDGKTSVTLGVARAYARLGLRVIAIEADLRRPSFARFTDVSPSAGLTGVLSGAMIARELIWLDAATLQPSGIDAGEGGAVGLLPAGELPDNPQRVLSDPSMSLVIEVARSLADIVLIDTAPVGTVNDATVLGQMVDGVVVVTRLNHSNKDAARRASRTLEKLGADLLGLVITDSAGGKQHHYYSATPPAASAAAPRERSAVRGGQD